MRSIRIAVHSARFPGSNRLFPTDLDPKNIVGIGVATTSSTIIPVDECGLPLASYREFQNNLAAQVWLWDDLTAYEEAELITKTVRKLGLTYLDNCGSRYSPDRYWSKIWHCLNTAPEVYQAAYSWVELCDFITGYLTGNRNPRTMLRSICTAGHKAMYSNEWGGYPAASFLKELAPELVRLLDSMNEQAYPSDRIAGYLDEEIASKIGLLAGIPVAVGTSDAPAGAIGAGIKPGMLTKIIGTSSCDMMVIPKDHKLKISGICGLVDDSIIPGMLGLEAGQSAVGDTLRWFVENLCPERYLRNPNPHEILAKYARKIKPGQSGLLALDWQNGNRSILSDSRLSGLMIGQTLQTTAPEMYRAIIESVGFGALIILDHLQDQRISVDEIVCTGGVVYKNPLFMQIYADIFARPLYVSQTTETCALGAAIYGAVAAGIYSCVSEAQTKMTHRSKKVYRPDPENTRIYARLFELYRQLYHSFGAGDLQGVMKQLIKIKNTPS